MNDEIWLILTNEWMYIMHMVMFSILFIVASFATGLSSKKNSASYIPQNYIGHDDQT